MIVLQTLGRQGIQAGIFQYERTGRGVTIDMSIGTAPSTPERIITFTDKEWATILAAINNQGVVNLQGNSTIGKSLHDLIKSALPSPSGFKSWNTSYLAYVCAILQHEGSIEFYAGVAGQGISVSFHFKAV